MKKLLFGIVFLAGMAYAAPRNITFVDPIGPATNTAAIVTISTITTQARTCLTEVNASVTSATQANILLSILDTGTTIYQVLRSTGNPVALFWNETDPFCVAPNHQLVITTSAPVAGAVITTNYKGYTY